MRTISVLQLFLAFAIGISSLFALFKIIKYLMKSVYKIEEENTSFAIFQTGIIISGSFILSSILSPALNAIRFLNPNNQFTSQTIMSSLGYITIFVLIGLFCTILVITSGLLVLFQLTKVNEGEEIKKNNIPIALITIAMIFGLSIIVDEYVGALCEALIPYPEIPKFY
ncbi:DUF350 domain-containing protein [Flavobacterium sp.]|uniref:DUF350 domain-containing protein n=1 Tax=Flavobacterium sp. TaxID=239 RepID=UPI0026079DEA|nr:DUF350 domain-containing protein [Flavobacterium sp.]